MPDKGPGHLKADCSHCFGLCCVVPAFAVSSDFAIDKAPGEPCPHLREDSRCGIHADLRVRGFAGCTVYDCFGAGQQVSQVTFGGRGWRTAPASAPVMFESFVVMRQLHELLWYLTEAVSLMAALDPRADLYDDLVAAQEATLALTALGPDELQRIEIEARRRDVNVLLVRASELARADAGGLGANHRGADLTGVDLRRADLTGADLRGADLRGADLSSAIFLIQSQLDAARGDFGTRLPAALSRPVHW